MCFKREQCVQPLDEEPLISKVEIYIPFHKTNWTQYKFNLRFLDTLNSTLPFIEK